MANVTVTLTADELRAWKALEKLRKKDRELNDEVDRGNKKTNQAATALGRLAQRVGRFDSRLRRIKFSVFDTLKSKIGGVSGALNTMMRGYKEWAEYHKQAGRDLSDLISAGSDLAFISKGVGDYRQKKQMVPGLIKQSGLSGAAAMRYIFQAQSRLVPSGDIKELKKYIDILGPQIRLLGDAPQAGIGVLEKTAAFKGVSPLDRLRAFHSAAGRSPVTAGAYAPGAAKVAGFGARVGLNLPQTLALLNTVVSGAASQDIGSTQAMRLLSNVQEAMNKMPSQQVTELRKRFAAGGGAEIVKWIGESEQRQRAFTDKSYAQHLARGGDPLEFQRMMLESDVRDSRAKIAYQTLADRLDRLREHEEGITREMRTNIIEHRGKVFDFTSEGGALRARAERELTKYEKAQMLGKGAVLRAAEFSRQEAQALREGPAESSGRYAGAMLFRNIPWLDPEYVKSGGNVGGLAGAVVDRMIGMESDPQPKPERESALTTKNLFDSPSNQLLREIVTNTRGTGEKRDAAPGDD